MLLEHELLTVARTWLYREKIEWEAAAGFRYLAAEMTAVEAPPELIRMAQKAEQDEIEHAGLCRAIVERLRPELEPLEVEAAGIMPASGEADLTRAERALYASLALSCVTETLSAALLIEMRKLTEDRQIHATINRILRDEVDHGRIGWAHLAWQAERSDVNRLGPYLPDMIRAALALDDESPRAPSSSAEHMGVLSPEHSRRIVESTFRDVVLPGLELHGVNVTAARDALAAYLSDTGSVPGPSSP